MTVENQNNKMPPQFMGAVEYEFTLDVLRADPTPEDAQRAIKCTVILADESTVELEFDKDYSVSFDDSLRGGTVTVVDPRTSEDRILIHREYELTQTALFQDFNKAPAETTMGVANKAIMLIQQMTERLERTLTVGIGSNVDLTLPDPDAGKAIIWNETQTGLVNSRTNVDELEGNVIEAVQAANMAVNSAMNARNEAERARGYAESIDPKDFTSDVFMIKNGHINPETGKADILFLPTEPTLVTKQLPTFASAAEAASGKDGVSVNTYSAYNIIGRNTALSNGYSVPLTTRYYNITLTFDRLIKAVAFTVMQGGVSNVSWPSYLASLEVSTDGIEWTPILSGLPNVNHVNESLNLDQKYLAYRFNIAAASVATGTMPHALGALNLFFEETVEATGTIVAFKVGNEYLDIGSTSANGNTFTHSFLAPIDLKDNADGTHNIATTPEGRELVGNILQPSAIHPQNPSEGDIYFNWMARKAYKFDGEEYQEFRGVPLGHATKQDGLITEVKTFPLNQNGFNVDVRNRDIIDFISGKPIPTTKNLVQQADDDIWLYGGASNGYMYIALCDASGTVLKLPDGSTAMIMNVGVPTTSYGVYHWTPLLPKGTYFKVYDVVSSTVGLIKYYGKGI